MPEPHPPMTPPFEPTPLPGTPPAHPREGAPIWKWLLALIVLVAVVITQRPGAPDPLKDAALRSGKEVGGDSLSLRIMAKLGAAARSLEEKGQFPPNDAQQLKEMFSTQSESVAATAADRWRLAVVQGVLDSPEAARAKLRELRDELDPSSPLIADTDLALRIYADPKERLATSPLVTDAERTDLADRHGWFARALLSNTEVIDPFRDSPTWTLAAQDGVGMIVVFGVFAMVVLLALIVGFAFDITAIIALATGKLTWRFTEYARFDGGQTEGHTDGQTSLPRGLFLETFIVFMIGFLAIKGVAYLVEPYASAHAMWPVHLQLGLQWCLALLTFWPLLRGMNKERFRREIGWHHGRGVFREIGAGICAYLAALPVYVLVAFVVVMIMFLQQAIERAGLPPDAKPPPPELPGDNKILDLLSGVDTFGLMLLASLVCLWAPLVEETIFRGAVYRHLRGLGRAKGPVIFLAIAGSAAAFAIVHAYVMAGVMMVATLGAVFGVMREWRGSLIASMTAHCIHNSVVLIIMLSVVTLARG